MTGRWLQALLLPVGPAAVAVLRFVLPYDTADDTATAAAEVAASPDRQGLVLWMGFVATMTLVPAVFWVGGVIRDRARALTTAAMVLLVPGYLAMAWLIGFDGLLWSAAQSGVDPATVVRLADGAHATEGLAASVFVAGHLIGTIVLGFAMWHSGVVPRWAAVATGISQPIHLLAVILSNPPLDLFGWGLQAVGFAAVSALLIRTARDAVPAPAQPVVRR